MDGIYGIGLKLIFFYVPILNATVEISWFDMVVLL